MSIKSDRWIREQAVQHKMIEPFSEKQVREGVISYGVSSYGYDLRVSNEFKIFTNVNSAIIDPKNFDERSFVSVEADTIIVPPPWRVQLSTFAFRAMCLLFVWARVRTRAAALL
jgi:dCTP deaminase